MDVALWGIYTVLMMLLCFKDMSGKEELKKIREQLEKIAQKEAERKSE